MKKIFARAYAKDTEFLNKIRLEGKLGLVASAQYLTTLRNASKIFKGSVVGGQVLGCNVNNALRIKDKVDAFLFIGTGMFHAVEVAHRTEKKTYIANPFNGKVTAITNAEIEAYRKRKRVAYLKFLRAKRVGILVSIKPGQYSPGRYLGLREKLKIAENLKKRIKKESYIFLFDTLDEKELENFPDIDCWVNTACPRIEYRNIVNMGDIK